VPGMICFTVAIGISMCRTVQDALHDQVPTLMQVLGELLGPQGLW
jgi:hypothetical protein